MSDPDVEFVLNVTPTVTEDIARLAGALDELLAADAAGALPVTGFLDRDGDLWLWDAARTQWSCYPTSADPTLHEADTARLSRTYGPLRSVVIHPIEEARRG